jgi:hypothetical protein
MFRRLLPNRPPRVHIQANQVAQATWRHTNRRGQCKGEAQDRFEKGPNGWLAARAIRFSDFEWARVVRRWPNWGRSVGCDLKERQVAFVAGSGRKEGGARRTDLLGFQHRRLANQVRHRCGPPPPTPTLACFFVFLLRTTQKTCRNPKGWKPAWTRNG